MSHCTACGKPLTPGVAFCTACGATIGAAPSATPGMPPAAIAPARVEASVVIGEAWRLAFGNVGIFLRTQGIFLLLGSFVGLAVLLAYIRPATGAMLVALEGATADPESFDVFGFLATMAPLMGWSALSGVVVGVFGLVGAGFGVVAADALRAGEKPTMGSVWARLSPRFGAYLATVLLAALAILGVVLAGAVLFFLVIPIVAAIVVAILLYLRWALAAPASIFEDRRPADNLRRSTELTKGMRGDIFVVGLVAIAINAIPAVVAGAILGFVSPTTDPMALGPVWVDVVRWAVGAASQMAAAFFLSAAIVVFYRRSTA